MLKKKLLVVVLLIVVVVAIWTIWGNTALQLNKYEIASSKLPKQFDGFNIVQISDLHNSEFGEDNKKLLDKIREANPGMIAITGDMIDSRRTDIDTALEFAEAAVKIAPCYYINGNHELRVLEYEELKKGLVELGITVLENESTEINVGNGEITVIGISDPSLEANELWSVEAEVVNEKLGELTKADKNYKLVLSHRPELFDIYCETGADLVLAGHAHGGQVRLPIVGGLIAPHQGFFPQYDGGLYIKEETNMIVSRGIGNSLFPIRFNNRPEVVLIELQAR